MLEAEAEVEAGQGGGEADVKGGAGFIECMTGVWDVEIVQLS
jgi:hypothetical protein